MWWCTARIPATVVGKVGESRTQGQNEQLNDIVRTHFRIKSAVVVTHYELSGFNPWYRDRGKIFNLPREQVIKRVQFLKTNTSLNERGLEKKEGSVTSQS